ncbi:4-galactosyl-N-acetylglucosaminide 3-alpha-L-fucosyltransferase 9-like isoform X2 [Clavelina lepadiformis]|uniref:4-galactosyl-N-acetylglucosaminide 3-alpha-L-fucosyltransferase 9-like isoform X2 n=1 Tax=Clavelina lepadiformis TaxID=159417 RepID=UPI0040415F65
MHRKRLLISAVLLINLACLLVLSTFHVVSKDWSESRKMGQKADQWNKTKNSPPNDRKILILQWHNAVAVGDKVVSRNCIITHNRSRIKEADAIFFTQNRISKEDMPWKYYRSDQIYVWWARYETPSIIECWKNDLRYIDEGFFNWTQSYRHDADVIVGFSDRGQVLSKLSRGKKVVDDILKNKNKLAIWMVSGCRTRKGQKLRMQYAMELDKAGIKFSRYGYCFNHNESQPRVSGSVVALTEHKFYFAFENSLHCKDYITEKFWQNSLKNGVVPIVWGPTKEDILSVAPLDSFIFAENFESPAELAKYLKFLDENDEEYRKYFKWREDETMTDERMVEMIKERYPNLDVYVNKRETLCDKLLQNNEPKVIQSLTDWYANQEPIECDGRF